MVIISFNEGNQPGHNKAHMGYTHIYRYNFHFVNFGLYYTPAQQLEAAVLAAK